jgi:hypothetical protein
MVMISRDYASGANADCGNASGELAPIITVAGDYRSWTVFRSFRGAVTMAGL